MQCAYILLSPSCHTFYFDSYNNLKEGYVLHNAVKVRSTKTHIPWKLVWYAAFKTEKEARNLELYLKTGSGKAFVIKDLFLKL